MSNSYIPKGFVKNIAIGLSNSFSLNNVPYRAGERCIFIGREQQNKKFQAFLNDPHKNGIFLVTGFRGMGKTSFVNFVLDRYCREHPDKKIIPVHLTMAQNQPMELDILKLITVSLFDAYRKIHEGSADSSENYRAKKSSLLRKGLVSFFILLFSLIIAYNNKNLEAYLQNNFIGFNIPATYGSGLLEFFSYVSLPVSYFILSITIIKLQIVKYKERKSQHTDIPYNRIKWLLERCNANVSEEIGLGEEITVQGVSTNIFSGSEKKLKTYTLSNPKEVEYELNNFLAKVKHEVEFIFVFDELDKVDPAISKSYTNELSSEQLNEHIENAYQHDLRERKQAIINIIAGLKNFFTSADARFIFIAGREMFDASMADIADRQSSIGSIFTYIFNIESLLKEENVTPGSMGNASLSAAIETYLSEIILGNRQPDFFRQLLDRFEAGANSLQENQRIYFILQNFISYLTYRSNGSPKKLIRVLHEFVQVGAEFDPRRTIMRLQDTANPKQLFLYFNYYNQYRVGFISYMYRPFQIQFGRSLKLFSDNIIVSTPYLFDHLIKFHPFAFSLANLELIPEVLSSNKTPSLRGHIRQLVEYLGANHIRETEISLFDYKFLSRTANEIVFLSKVFEEESAAYNFTLDESYLVKLLVIGQIKIERKANTNFRTDDASAQIYSIAHLNGILGDLHFFDQEYNDAITAYSDAIRPINNKRMDLINYRDFVTLIKNKLKLGLCFEKIYSYEEAQAFYGDCCQDARKFMHFHLQNRVRQPLEDYSKEDGNSADKNLIYTDASLNDLLSLISHAFIASSTIQEKMVQDGATIYKHAISMGSFLKIVKGTEAYSARNYQVCANLFLLTGKLYYFKNSPGKIDSFDSLLSDSLPAAEYELIGKVINRLNDARLVEFNPSKRRPIIALAMYILCIDEVIRSRFAGPACIDAILKEGNFASHLLNHVHTILENKPSIFTGSHYRHIAVALSNIGDCLLSMLQMKMVGKKEGDYKEFSIGDIISRNGLKIFEKNQNTVTFDEVLVHSKANFTITDIIKCYYYSGNFYREFGRNISYSYQYRKILYVLRLILKYDTAANNEKYADVLQHLLIRPILEITSQNTGHTDRHMIQKAKDLGLSGGIQSNLSNHPETQEVHLLFNYIKLKMSVNEGPHETNAYATQYIRLLDLDFHAKEMAMHVKLEFESAEKKAVYNYLNPVTDYFYYMLTILQTLKIYGTDYMVGQSYLAYTHYRIGEFLGDLKKHSLKTFKTKEKAEEKYKQFIRILKIRLISSLGKSTFSSLDIIYHYRMARDLYRKSEQLHQAGNEYKKAIQNMTYLEDDYSDNAYHFGAALDRYKMINGGFQRRIEKCEEFLNKYSFHDLFINDEGVEMVFGSNEPFPE